MNVIWIVADTFRKDHIGAYGSESIRTPTLDSLSGMSVRFDRHYAAGFPTMPTRADHATGRWTMSFMGWEPLPEGETTLAQVLAANGYHTAAVVDTPFYVRGGMNYDRGFQTFFIQPGQDAPGTKEPAEGHRHESQDVRRAWRYESDCNSPQTMSTAMRWLERHHKEDFFLYVDTWDPHEPWDSPVYYTEPYWPGHDGEVIDPSYGRWQNVPGFTQERVNKAHAAYCGQITMVDTWIGFLLTRVANMGLMDNTAIIFTTDHGFYFGEHGGLFGKMNLSRNTDGSLPKQGDPGGGWTHSPLYEELVHIPLMAYIPGVEPGAYSQLTSVVDVMPTVLDFLGQDIPASVQGKSLLPRLQGKSPPGRDYTISTIPFANPGDPVRSVDDFRRDLRSPLATTVTSGDWSLLYSAEAGVSELFNLKEDPAQRDNVISSRLEMARELHQLLLQFMRETNVAPHLVNSRLELKA